MVTIESGLFLKVQELENGPKPFPLQSGFSHSNAYRVLGLYNPSETSEAYFILANDRDEIWFISNKHFRVVGLFPDNHNFRLALTESIAITS